MHAIDENRRPLANLVAGQLYDFQAKNQKSESDSAVTPRDVLDAELTKLFGTMPPMAMPAKSDVNLPESFPAPTKEELSALKSGLETQVADRAKYGIAKDSNDIRCNMLPTLMAKALITAEGHLNVAQFDAVKQAFFVKGYAPNQKVISDVLDEFSKQSECYDLLCATKAPASFDVPSWSLILSMLDLPADTQVTDVHARTCALSACLAQVVKTSIDSDVTESFGQMLKRTNLARFLCDINDLLANGCLERAVDGHDESQSFGLDTNNQVLETPLKVASDGSITSHWFAKNYKIWQVHGIIAACNALGISKEDMPKEIIEVLAALPKTSFDGKRFSVTPKDLILALAGVGEAEEDYEDLSEEACFAFTSVYENPLLRSWQNALTQMAHFRPNLVLTARVHHAVQEALFSHFTSDSKREQKRIAKIFTEVLANLNKELTESSPKSAADLQALVIKVLPQDGLELEPITAFVNSEVFAKAVTPSLAPISPSVSDLVKTYGGSQTQRFTAKNAQDVLASLLKFEQKTTLCSPQQALIFDPSKIQETLKKFSLTVREQKSIYAIVNTYLDESVQETFNELLEGMGTEWTLDVFRSELLARAKPLMEANVVDVAIHEIDSELVNCMYHKDINITIPFAASTWEVKGAGLTLCFHVEKKKLVIGMMQDDVAISLNQKEWAEGSWEIGQTEVLV